MGFGIIVYEHFGRFYPFTMADDTLYDGMREGMLSKHGMNFINGKKGITDEEINEIDKQICGIVKKVNDGESLNLEKELEFIFK